MPDCNHYVPILKGLAGEYKALKELRGSRSSLTPMVDVPPIGWNFDEKAPAKTVDEHLKGFAKKIEKCWTSGQIFFDFYMLQDDVMADGRHPLLYAFDCMRRVGVGTFFGHIHSIPVTGLNRPRRYQTAVRHVTAQDGRGVCVRLESADFDDADNLEGEITKLLKEIQVEPVHTDLVVDLKELPTSLSGPTKIAVRTMLKGLPMLRQWRTLTFAASSFPRNLSEVHPEQISVLPRAEWLLWQALRKGKEKLPRIPAFGDYGIRAPHFPDAEIDPKALRSSPNIRYTTIEDWLVLKGRKPKTPIAEKPTIDSDALCRELVEREEFCGASFSWGDSWIQNCANGRDGNGNGTTWTAVGTSHHLAFVRSQIASLSGS
jgi:hypothetical protein